MNNFIKKDIRFLVLWVGTKCTLRCKNCCNFVPYLESKIYSAEKIIDNICYITKDVKINLLQIQGGEPFMHPDISKIIDSCLYQPNIENIEVASNATIIPNKESIDVLSKHPGKVKVRLSNYKCVSNSFKKDLILYLKNGGVTVDTYDFRDGDGSWMDFGDIDREKEDDISVVHDTYVNCRNRYCWVIADDYLATCGRMISLMQLKHETNYGQNNILNITELRKNNVDFRDVLTDFDRNYGRISPPICGYCSGDHRKIPAAIQL